MDDNTQTPQTSVFHYDEVGFPYVDVMPENAFKCRHWLEFYRLKERKRKHTLDNIEINEGCFYLIKATRSERWYVREITQFTEPQSLTDKIREENIFLLYTEEIAESIRSDVESSGLSYHKFLVRAEAAMMEEVVKRESYYDTGKVTNLSIQRDKINQIKKYR